MTDTARSQRPDQGGARPGGARRGVSGRLSGVRTRVRSLPGGKVAWRIGITVVGLAVIAVGVVLLPLPGPGWLIIFAGLGLLATEYEWASRLLRRTRGLVVGWTQWAARQSLPARIGIGLLGLVVVAGAIAGSWYLYTIV